MRLEVQEKNWAKRKFFKNILVFWQKGVQEMMRGV
jgi:hypothetical protein